MSLTPARKKEIRQITSELQGKTLKEIADERGVSHFIIDLKRLIPQNELSGVIIHDKGTYRIFISENDSENRQRFTFAHELGHFFLHKDYLIEKSLILDAPSYIPRDLDLSGLDEKQKLMEAEANHFAAELLMPEDLVRDLYSKSKDLGILAKSLNVSESAVGYRISNLGLDG